MARDLERLFGSRVRVIAAAVSDHAGHAELRIPVNGSGLATIEAANGLDGAKFETVTAPMVRLDDSNLGDVGFLKVDVEGHELAVLKGGEQMLRSSKPIILIEAEDRHRPDAVQSVTDFLLGLGYSGWFLFNGALTPIARKPAALGIYNYVFLPG
jgi:FkbM family methyltransferase